MIQDSRSRLCDYDDGSVVVVLGGDRNRGSEERWQ